MIDNLIRSAPEVPIPELPELPDEPREAFRLLFAFQRDSLRLEPIEEAWKARRLAVYEPAWRAPYKRRKFDMVQAAVEFPGIAAHFEAEGQQISKRFWSLKSQIKDKLVELAEQVTPVPGDTWHEADVVNSTSYNTQGFSAHSYAKRSAESQIPHYAANGLEAEVRVNRWDDRPDYKPLFGRKRSGIADYEVWVKADPVDIEIARRRPGMSLKDWLQWCWANGVNPRVYDPMLPHGLEQRLGVSINGGWSP